MNASDIALFIIFLLNLLGSIIVENIFKNKYDITGIGYSLKKTWLKHLKFGFLIEITLITIIFSYFPPKINLLKLMLFCIAIISFISFLKDLFIDKEKTAEYIIALQKASSTENIIQDLFEIDSTNTDYVEKKSDVYQRFSLIKHEGIQSLLVRLDRQYRLVPKQKMSENELKYIQEVLSLNLNKISNNEQLKNFKINTFNNKELYNFLKIIEYRNRSKILNSIKQHNIRAKFNLIIRIIGGVFLIILCFFMLFYQENVTDFIVNWLVNI